MRDSGAVLVGAATSGHPHVALESTNRGTAVDCFAWGERVVTTGGDSGHSLSGAYNFDYSGTSSASAIVAGVALVLQGIAKRSSAGPLAPRELRSLLGHRSLGTPSASPRRDLIGVMPDLEKLLASPEARDESAGVEGDAGGSYPCCRAAASGASRSTVAHRSSTSRTRPSQPGTGSIAPEVTPAAWT